MRALRLFVASLVISVGVAAGFTTAAGATDSTTCVPGPGPTGCLVQAQLLDSTDPTGVALASNPAPSGVDVPVPPITVGAPRTSASTPTLPSPPDVSPYHVIVQTLPTGPLLVLCLTVKEAQGTILAPLGNQNCFYIGDASQLPPMPTYSAALYPNDPNNPDILTVCVTVQEIQKKACVIVF